MAGLIPQTFIDDLLNRADIIDIIGAHVSLKKAGANYQALCPFHDEKTPSFTVSPSKQFYHCFGCSAHGSVIRFLMEYQGLGFVEAVQELAGVVGLVVPEQTGNAGRVVSDNEALYAVVEQAAQFYTKQLRAHPASKVAIAYLKQRGLSGEIAAEYGLGFAPPGWNNLLQALGGRAQAALVKAGLAIEKDGRHYDRFRDRIIFPIHDSRGRVIAFGGRVLDQGEPKYLNSPETRLFQKGRELYGLHHALQHRRDTSNVIVVEGYMDVLALVQHGVRNVVATLGTATTKDNLGRLFRCSPNVLFCFDGDRAGQQAAWRALETALALLEEGRSVKFLFLAEGEDPDSLVRKQGPEFLLDKETQVPLSEFLFQRLTRDADLATSEGRARLLEQATPMINKIPSRPLQDLLYQRLLHETGIDTQRPHTGASTTRNPRPDDVGATPRAGSPSLVRTAIDLLLRQPALAAHVEQPAALKSLSMSGIPLLVELIEKFKAQPHLSIASLLESYSGREEGAHLAKILAKAPILPEDVFESEFLGAIQCLHQRRVSHRRQTLMKIDAAALTAEEKAELDKLLAFQPSKVYT